MASENGVQGAGAERGGSRVAAKGCEADKGRYRMANHGDKGGLGYLYFSRVLGGLQGGRGLYMRRE